MKHFVLALFLLLVVFLFPHLVLATNNDLTPATRFSIKDASTFLKESSSNSLFTPTSAFTTTTYSWEQVTLPISVTIDAVNDLAVHPLDACTIFLGTSVGLYKSPDAGQSWISVAPAVFGNVFEIAIAPSDPQRLYARAGSFLWEQTLYRSNDGGVTWDPILSPPSNCGLSVAPSNSNRLYTRKCKDWGDTPSLFRSDDGGQSWITPTLFFTQTLTAVAVAPTRPDLVMAASYNDVFRSVNGGSSWDRSQVYGSEIVFDPDSPYMLYVVGDSSGVLRSADLGDTWEDSDIGRGFSTLITSPFGKDQLLGMSNGWVDDQSGWNIVSNGSTWRASPWEMPLSWQSSLRRSFKGNQVLYLLNYDRLWRYIGREKSWHTSLFLPMVHRTESSNFPDAAQQALERANIYRARVGVVPLRLHSAIITAAQNHATYHMLNFNDPSAWENGPHGEVEGKPGYTGEWPSWRILAAGYPWNAYGEVMHYLANPVASVDGWMATVYHRLPLIDPELHYTGYGNDKNAQTAVDVMDFGFGLIEAGFWLSTHPFPLAYPIDGQTDVPLSWDGYESPDPLPPGASHPVGYTFTLQGVGGHLQVDAIEMRDGHGHLVAVHPNPPDCGRTPDEGDNCYALIAVSPLEPGTRYTVQAQGNIMQWQGPDTILVPFNRTWSFTTTTSGTP